MPSPSRRPQHYFVMARGQNQDTPDLDLAKAHAQALGKLPRYSRVVVARALRLRGLEGKKHD
ncbi:MAG: hypothetical protein HY532_00570 [Chloroflexi bacterium]|nr:hypothetical protein [Chloroflexota bacterium]